LSSNGNIGVGLWGSKVSIKSIKEQRQPDNVEHNVTHHHKLPALSRERPKETVWDIARIGLKRLGPAWRVGLQLLNIRLWGATAAQQGLIVLIGKLVIMKLPSIWPVNSRILPVRKI
jgi:hypothetical protein